MFDFIRETCRIMNKMVPNCFRYYTNLDCKCEICDVNFFLVEEKRCCSIMPNVKNYNMNCNPTQCEENYRISAKAPKCVRVTSNCASYQEDDSCLVCENKFSLSENQCKLIVCELEYRFSVKQQKCVKLISHCKSYREDDSCMVCENNFSLSENQCKPIVCEREYRFSEKQQKCVLLISHCISYREDDSCMVCENNFSVSENQCKLIKLIDCELEYRFSVKQQKCIKLISNCISYREDDSCKECDNNFLLSENQCKQIECEQDYRYSANKKKCVKVISNCLSYKTDDNCNECENNFYLSENQCIPNYESKTDNSNNIDQKLILIPIVIVIVIIVLFLLFKIIKRYLRINSNNNPNNIELAQTRTQSYEIVVSFNSLEDYLKINNKSLKMKTKIEIAKTICEHVKNLHSNNKFYEDINVKNIRILDNKPIFESLQENNGTDSANTNINFDMVKQILEKIFKKERKIKCFGKRSKIEKTIGKLFIDLRNDINKNMDFIINSLNKIDF